jgi:hypothetical protein
MTVKKKFSLSLIVLLFISIFAPAKNANAQTDTRGTDFWVCFPQNAKNEFNAGLAFKLYITGDLATKGTVLVPGKPSIPFAIKPGEVIGIDIDTNMQVFGSDVIRSLGIHVHCDQPVAVYGLSNRKASTDTYVAFPTNVLGTAYRALCYDALSGTEDAFTSQITFVATDDNTIVTIAPTCNTKGGRHGGETFSVTLQRGELYQMQGTIHGGYKADLTGTLVTSTKPIAFFTGHICAQVPANVNFCDQLLEEEAPINTWGRQFLIGKLLGKDWYAVRVVANEDDTKIFFDGKFIKSLAAGEFYEAQKLRDNLKIKSDKPVLVGQFATSSDADTVKIGDPFLMLITPTEQFLQSYRFVTPVKGDVVKNIPPQGMAGDTTLRSQIVPAKEKPVREEAVQIRKKKGGYPSNSISTDDVFVRIPDNNSYAILLSGWHHYINVVAPIASVNSIRLDGQAVSSNKFTPISITRFAIAQIEISYGSHTITCDRPFGLYSYGFGVGGDNYDSYGNSAGQRVAPIERIADTSKPTLEIVQSDSTSDLVLIARDDRINDLGLATIQITDSSNTANPVAYPVFDVGAPEFTFGIKRGTVTSCLYVKLQDFAKNQSYYALCPASPNSSGAANEVLRYNITPILMQQQTAHEVYPIEIYPSPAKYGQLVNINFTNSIPEIIGAQVLDEGGNIVTDLLKKELTGSGKHTLIYPSGKYASGSFFLRISSYSQDSQVLCKQDEHFVVAH